MIAGGRSRVSWPYPRLLSHFLSATHENQHRVPLPSSFLIVVVVVVPATPAVAVIPGALYRASVTLAASLDSEDFVPRMRRHCAEATRQIRSLPRK